MRRMMSSPEAMGRIKSSPEAMGRIKTSPEEETLNEKRQREKGL